MKSETIEDRVLLPITFANQATHDCPLAACGHGRIYEAFRKRGETDHEVTVDGRGPIMAGERPQ